MDGSCKEEYACIEAYSAKNERLNPSSVYRVQLSKEGLIQETFSSWIKEARDKPTISMLEQIRIQVMNKIIEKRKSMDKWINEWSPYCMRKFQDNMQISSQCTIYFNGNNGFEITHRGDRQIVFLDSRIRNEPFAKGFGKKSYRKPKGADGGMALHIDESTGYMIYKANLNLQCFG
ncbi:hypothetical protein GH714_016094 [Hevea brasiliensis]|uniref:Uncharacterized protein n=1 Tax=Hevea brasiliensis TaxID=3981 RepID=A0A6A6LC62_HEVBR|nr:hypothetical protein GH714_016094 [Hevea brasiliensis]